MEWKILESPIYRNLKCLVKSLEKENPTLSQASSPPPPKIHQSKKQKKNEWLKPGQNKGADGILWSVDVPCHFFFPKETGPVTRPIWTPIRAVLCEWESWVGFEAA